MRKTGAWEDARIPVSVAILMAVLQAIRIAWMARLPEGILVQHIPDDAFYYLVLAKNYVTLGRWTFDGTSTSTGFHLMWGYILALFYKIAPAITFKEIFVIASALGAVSLSVAAGLCVSSVRRIYGPQSAWAAVVILFSALSLLQATWMMESSLVILMGSLLLFQISADIQRVTYRNLAIAILLGLLGSMARSDFGLLPLWLFVACAVLARIERKWLPQAKLAAGQLIGSSLGVLIVLMHSYKVSGHLVQASAQTKLWWVTVQGKSVVPSLRVAENTLSPLYNSVAPFQYNVWSSHLMEFIGYKSRTVIAAIVLIGIVRLLLRSLRTRPAVFAVCMILLIASYSFFYRFDGAVQDWYVANYEIPLILLVAAAWSSITPRWFVVARTLVVAMVILGSLFSFRAHAPWQEAMYRSGILISKHPEWKPVGAWNAGIMHYFAGDGVVNLDGLVNDDLVPDIKKQHLASYVARRKIRYIIESPDIFTGILAERSGIGDGKLYACVSDKKVLFPRDPFDVFDHTHITMFRLDPACLDTLH